MKSVRKFCAALFSRKFMPTAIKVALIVGSIVFFINHGYALVKGHMSSDRWFSALLTYIVPYIVNVHGQYVSHSRSYWGDSR
ncbi:hypothetical protein CEN39_22630 [Fischerella thermalis CCMEE 5201]|jgi:hypothetical protein|nr:hypothetical protein CEN39_22630 [Fischerella thermalis CCMEE 5201]